MTLYYIKKDICAQDRQTILDFFSQKDLGADYLFEKETCKKHEKIMVFREKMEFGLLHNSFSPRIIVKYDESAEESVVHIVFTLQPVVRKMMGVYGAVMVFYALLSLLVIVLYAPHLMFVNQIPLLLMLALVLVSVFLFNSTSKRIFRDIKERLGARRGKIGGDSAS